MVSRPLAGTSATAERTTLPLARTTRTSSSSSTIRAPTRSPRSSLSLRHLDAQTAAALTAVLLDGGALRVAALGHDEDVILRPETTDAVEQAVVAAEVHPDDTGRSIGPSGAAPRRSR